MNCKQTWNPKLSGHSRDQAGHPVIAVNEIRLHTMNDVVDHLPLEDQSDAGVVFLVGAINFVPVVEDSILRQLDSISRQLPVIET